MATSIYCTLASPIAPSVHPAKASFHPFVHLSWKILEVHALLAGRGSHSKARLKLANQSTWDATLYVNDSRVFAQIFRPSIFTSHFLLLKWPLANRDFHGFSSLRSYRTRENCESIAANLVVWLFLFLLFAFRHLSHCP